MKKRRFISAYVRHTSVQIEIQKGQNKKKPYRGAEGSSPSFFTKNHKKNKIMFVLIKTKNDSFIVVSEATFKAQFEPLNVEIIRMSTDFDYLFELSNTLKCI